MAHRERLVQLMFETYNAPATYLACAPMLDVYASGRNTAMVLAIGDGVVQTFPIANGRTFPPAVQRMNLAGDVLTNHMQRVRRGVGASGECYFGYNLVGNLFVFIYF